MKRWIRDLVKAGFSSVGFYIARKFPNCINSYSLQDDLGVLIPKQAPLCFDVGANQGQTIDLLQRTFPNPVIHAFEPASSTFSELTKLKQASRLHIHQLAFGEQVGVAEFRNYQQSELSSFLAMNPDKTENLFAEEEIVSIEPVQVETLDHFCTAQGIDQIDLLKIDTQGYELPVLHGGIQLFKQAKIKAVLLELNFATLYQGQSDFLTILHFLREHKMRLIDYYEKERATGRHLSWTTALFMRYH